MKSEKNHNYALLKRNSSKSKSFFRKKLQQIRLVGLVFKDISRFSRTAAFSFSNQNIDALEARVMYNVHAIEKGLSRTKNRRHGFGKKALADLNDSLVLYLQNDYPIEKYAFQQGISILHEYRKSHKNSDLLNFNKVIDKSLLNFKFENVKNGYLTVRKEDKLNNKEKNFFELSQSRVSVREFSEEKIELSQIMNAIKIAEKTPSVCNRQGWKVYCVINEEKIDKLLQLQLGFDNYGERPSAVLGIAVSNETLLSPVERNEAFVDGGLFSMSVLYALEYEKVATVALNAMMNSSQEDAIRRLLAVEDAHQLIVFIAVGSFLDEGISPVSARRPSSEFVKVI